MGGGRKLRKGRVSELGVVALWFLCGRSAKLLGVGHAAAVGTTVLGLGVDASALAMVARFIIWSAITAATSTRSGSATSAQEAFRMANPQQLQLLSRESTR